MIHVSLDQDKAPALKWAKSFNQPWPILLPGDYKRKTMVDPYNVRAVPTYVLVDQTGQEVARGKAAALAMAKKAEE
jgi:hypothetical protein